MICLILTMHKTLLISFSIYCMRILMKSQLLTIVVLKVEAVYSTSIPVELFNTRCDPAWRSKRRTAAVWRGGAYRLRKQRRQTMLSRTQNGAVTSKTAAIISLSTRERTATTGWGRVKYSRRPPNGAVAQRRVWLIIGMKILWGQ